MPHASSPAPGLKSLLSGRPDDTRSPAASHVARHLRQRKRWVLPWRTNPADQPADGPAGRPTPCRGPSGRRRLRQSNATVVRTTGRHTLARTADHPADAPGRTRSPKQPTTPRTRPAARPRRALPCPADDPNAARPALASKICLNAGLAPRSRSFSLWRAQASPGLSSAPTHTCGTGSVLLRGRPALPRPSDSARGRAAPGRTRRALSPSSKMHLNTRREPCSRSFSLWRAQAYPGPSSAPTHTFGTGSALLLGRPAPRRVLPRPADDPRGPVPRYGPTGCTSSWPMPGVPLWPADQRRATRRDNAQRRPCGRGRQVALRAPPPRPPPQPRQRPRQPHARNSVGARRGSAASVARVATETEYF